MSKKNSRVGVVIVDMQDFFLKKFDHDKVDLLIKNQLKLLDFCIKYRIPIFVLEYEKRGKTTKLLQTVLKKIKNIETIVKDSNSGFRNTNLEELLNNAKVKRIILMGINGSGCVQDTAIGAIRRGYKIITSSKIIASNTIKDANLATSRKWYSKNGDFFDSTGDLLRYIMNK